MTERIANFMVEKQASSEIAESREDQQRARNLMRELALPDDQAVVDLIADVLKIWRESWERDIRERCAHIVDAWLDTHENLGTHELAERIRGKE